MQAARVTVLLRFLPIKRDIAFPCKIQLKKGEKMKKIKSFISVLMAVAILASCLAFHVSAESADTPTLNFSVTEEGKKRDGVSFGELVRYYAKTDIDGDWTKCEFEFTMGPEIVFQNGTLSVEYRTEGNYNYNKLDSSAYTASAVENQKFTVSIDDFGSFYGNTTLRVIYKVKLDENKTVMGKSVYSSAALNFTKGGVSDSVEADDVCEIHTGGYKFQRVANDNVTPVAGAEYDVYTDYDIKVARKTSDSEGNFDVKGLTYGDYYLVETSVPDGYECISDKIYFTVTETSYDDSEKLKISSVVVDPGDLNGDGLVSTVDLVYLHWYVAGLLEDDEIQIQNADVNGDGMITTSDVSSLKKIIAGISK